MYSLGKFHARGESLSAPLSHPYTIFDFENIRFRLGTTSMIAGKPGAMKSTLARNMMLHWANEGVPTMYFAADSQEEEMARACAAIMTGKPTNTVDADFDRGAYAEYLPSLQTLGNIRFEYGSPGSQDGTEFVSERMKAFEDAHGSYPQLVFIDNLMDFAETTDDWAAMRDMTRELKGVAYETGAHICVLHHASEGWGQACDPVPRAAIQGKVTQMPVLVLTVAIQATNLYVCCVKNRYGPAYPDATRPLSFNFDQSLTIYDNPIREGM